MNTQKRIRIHQYHELVAFDMDSMEETLYLDACQAVTFGKELIRFGKETGKPNVSRRWWCVRLIQMVNGWKSTATNETDGKSRAYYII